MLLRERVRLLAAAAVAALAVTVAASLAATGDLTYSDCIANGGAAGCATPAHDSLGAADAVAASPDSKSVYVTSAAGDSITHFSGESDGAFTYEDCIADGGANGCADPPHDSLGHAVGLDVSPDGETAYVASGDANSVTRFSRASDGTLTYEDCIADGGANGCADPTNDSLTWPEGVAVSPDGKSVYVTSRDDGAITRFKRASNGSLTYKDCIANGGVEGCASPAHDSLAGAVAVEASADGKSVYVASAAANSVTRFNRASNGSLTYKDCIANAGANGCVTPAHDSIGYTFDVTVSGDGTSVYAASLTADSITRFKRSSNGSLTYKDCTANAGANGCVTPTNDSLTGPTGVAVSPDGESVYVASRDANAVTRFTRASNGSLTYQGCIADAGANGCATPAHDSLWGPYDIAVSPDGSSVYVPSITGNSLTGLERELGPPKTKIKSAEINRDKRKATFKFSSSEPGSTFRCKLDGKDYEDCDSPRTYKDLAKGEHTFKVEAENSQGTPDSTPAEKSFKI